MYYYYNKNNILLFGMFYQNIVFSTKKKEKEKHITPLITFNSLYTSIKIISCIDKMKNLLLLY